MIRNRLLAPLFCTLLVSAPVLAETPRENAKGAGPLVDFSVEARQNAANDQGSAVAFYEAEAANPADLAKKVNAVIAQALAVARQAKEVQTRSGNTWTTPIYGKNLSSRNNGSIDSWRMRSELLLESRDIPALAALLGQLQNTLGVSQISLQPAPETRARAEDAATTEAIAAFRVKAGKIARQLGRDYRIVQINVGSSRAPVFALKAMSARADAAPMPLEGGESQVTVSVSGQIEVLP